MIATPKLIGMIVAIICGVALAITGSALDDEALKLAGIAMASSTSGILYGNGKSARQGETAAPAIMPGPRNRNDED